MPVTAAGQPQHVIGVHRRDDVVIELHPFVVFLAHPADVMAGRAGAALMRENGAQRVEAAVVAAEICGFFFCVVKVGK